MKPDKKKHAEDMRKWRAENPERARAIQKKWRDNNREKKRKASRKWNHNNKEKCIKHAKDWKKENKEKYNAEQKALYHIKIPNLQMCQVCKKELATERHHRDYSKPLEVVFVCKNCHPKLNKKVLEDG